MVWCNGWHFYFVWSNVVRAFGCCRAVNNIALFRWGEWMGVHQTSGMDGVTQFCRDSFSCNVPSGWTYCRPFPRLYFPLMTGVCCQAPAGSTAGYSSPPSSYLICIVKLYMYWLRNIFRFKNLPSIYSVTYDVNVCVDVPNFIIINKL
jgi:hypothetical protein